MKKNRLTALILTFVLLFGCLSVLPVFAEEAAEDGQKKIVAQNVVYSEKIQIAYAVDYDIDTAENDVKVAYTVDGETKLATYWGVENVKGTDYPVFVTEGFHANEFTKQVSAVAYTGEEAPADATPKLYSVGQYFYSMLYKQNYITKTEGKDGARKDLYLSAIEFGTNAQKVLDDATGNALLDQYCFVYAADDVYINGDYAALVPAGTELTLVREGATKYQITINGNVSDLEGNTYTAEAGVKALITGVGGGVTDTKEVMTYTDGASSDYVKSYDADGNLITGNLPANANTLTMGLATDGDNQFLQVRNYVNSNKVGKTEVQLSNTVQTGNCYTFETKINIKGATAGYNFAQLKFVNNNGGEAVNLYLGYATVDGKTGFAVATTGDNASVAKGTKLFDATDKVITTATGWCTLKIEFYFGGPVAEDAGDDVVAAAKAQTYMKLYVDGILAYDGQANWAMGANISHAQIDHISAGKTHNSCYDDISFTRTDKAYVEGNN